MMLVPQPPICQRCGYRPAVVPFFCPVCGAPFPVPWPGQRFGSSPVVPVIPSRSHAVPLIVEIVLNCCGIFGLGWIWSGYATVGIALLIGSLMLWPLMFFLTLFTMGLTLLCLVPVVIVATMCNALLLLLAMRRSAS